jgi:hypothetical protein
MRRADFFEGRKFTGAVLDAQVAARIEGTSRGE